MAANLFQQVLQNLSVTPNLTPFTLESLENFPISDWLALQERYKELQDWYDGTKLIQKTVDVKNNISTETYPIRINPIPRNCERHAGVLFGEIENTLETGSLPISFEVVSNPRAEALEKELKSIITDLWINSNGASMMLTNGLLSQYMGGCIYWASWQPKKSTIKISAPQPREFLAYPYSNDPFRLREVWIIREVSQNEASVFTGGKIPKTTLIATDPVVTPAHFYYIEHWDEKEYYCRINDFPLQDDEGDELSGENPFGFVPGVYIPHIRSKSFLGESIITEAAKGLIKELNARSADVGDAVSEDTHTTLAMRNVKGNPQLKKIATGETVLDLGGGTGLTGNEPQPDLFSVKKQSLSEPMLKFTDTLEKHYRREVSVPAVADGEDEGSQRSALTLSTRMFPLVAHARSERIFWTDGLSRFNKMMLQMLSIKSVVSEDIEKFAIRTVWQSMLPPDREALNQEMSSRRSSKTISRRSAIKRFGDIFDIEAEIKELDEEAVKDAENKAASQPQQPFGNTVSNGKTPPGGNNGSKSDSQRPGAERDPQRGAVSNQKQGPGSQRA